MPALRGKNLRSGDLAEQLGLLLLQNLALVAPVPRTEDVGIDAVVTLLRPFGKTMLIAKDSLFVQIKSASVREVVFEGPQVEWLFALELPFMIASVDRPSNSVQLFCCHRLSDAYIMKRERHRVVVHLESEEHPADYVEPDIEDVYVGPPILEWSMDVLANDGEYADLFFSICSEHCRVARESIETRRVGQSFTTAWKTNQMPVFAGWKSAMTDEVSMDDVADIAMPYFTRMLDKAVNTGSEEWLKELESLAKGSRRMLQVLKLARALHRR